MENKSNIISKTSLMFERNIGQHKNKSKFVLRTSKGTVFFLNSEIVFALMKSKEDKNKDKFMHKKNIEPKEYEVNFFRMILKNSNENPQIVGADEFDCRINYFKGKDSSKWITNIPIYGKLTYKEVYPGIDLAYYENQRILEYDFIISPNADINNIKMTFEGVDKIEKDADGNVLISVKENIVQMLKPRAYQEIDNTKVEVESSFIMDSDGIRFDIPSYDKSKVLVIDPPILYGTYLGGNDSEYGFGVAVDTNENAYVTGWTWSIEELPLKNEYQDTLKGDIDAFLIKIDTKASGQSSLKYASYLGGNNYDTGYGVAVDTNENAYITGYTYLSEEFPLKNAYQETIKGDVGGFLIKIDTKEIGESSLKYGSYLGGNNFTYGASVVVDVNENAYIAGWTWSTEEFPLKNAYQETIKGYADIFLIKIDTKEIRESSLKYGTYLGGNSYNYGMGVAIDGNENAYITGYTYSAEDFPLKNAYQDTLKGNIGGFLIKIDTKEIGELSLKYGSYLGGNGYNIGYEVAADKNENAYISGYTNSTEEFPLKNAYQEIKNEYYDAFLIKIDTKEVGESSLKYGSYLGGNNDDYGNGIVVDINENAYITGYTYSSQEFPLKNAYQDTLKGEIDAFLIKIDTKEVGESSLKYGTYLGGNSDDYGSGIAVDINENAYITGVTYSIQGFPLKNAYQDNLKGYGDAFLIKINTKSSDLALKKFVYKCEECVENNIPYVIEVTNAGPDEATNIIVTDIIQNGLVIKFLDSDIGTIENVGNTVTWVIEKLEVGQKGVAVIDVTITNVLFYKRNETVINTATLTTDVNLINPENSTDTVVSCIKNKGGKNTVKHIIINI